MPKNLLKQQQFLTGESRQAESPSNIYKPMLRILYLAIVRLGDLTRTLVINLFLTVKFCSRDENALYQEHESQSEDRNKQINSDNLFANEVDSDCSTESEEDEAYFGYMLEDNERYVISHCSISNFAVPFCVD